MDPDICFGRIIGSMGTWKYGLVKGGFTLVMSGLGVSIEGTDGRITLLNIRVYRLCNIPW